MSHALLSPSSASRWLNCTPSARLEAGYPDTSGEAAREGTLAHKLAEVLLRHATGGISDIVRNAELAVIKQDPLYNEAMQEHCEVYASYVLEQFAEAKKHTKDAIIYLEQRIDMTAYVPDGFGTGDVFIIADETLYFIDLKYGKGVPVSADNNKQLMLYALGAFVKFQESFDIERVRMTIYQPRLDSVSTFEMVAEALIEWAETELRPKAQLAFEGEGEFSPGKHCQFCKVKATCKANADYHLAIQKHEFKEPVLLNDSEIVDILDRSDAFSNWLKSVTEYAFLKAVNEGKKWPGYKLVEGRSNRKIADEEKAVEVLTGIGIADIFKPRELQTITFLEKAVGKKTFEAVMSPLLIKPPGKPTLVPDTDKRPEFHSSESIKAEFADE